MQLIYEASKILSIAAFLLYGLSCLFADGMVAEFERFGLSRFRRLTGALEVAGALGLVAGYRFPVFTVAASGGLAALMLLGIATRLRLRDPFVATLPALLLLLINLWVLVYSTVPA